jgi:hypothetical protein
MNDVSLNTFRLNPLKNDKENKCDTKNQVASALC